MKRILIKNKGITLMEVILVVALVGIMVPIVTLLIKNAFSDSNTLSQRVKIQNAVIALMNKFEQTIKEADIPVANSSFQNNKMLILKPNGETLFTFVPETSTVICEEKDLEGNILATTEYEDITGIDVQLKYGGYGATIELTGGKDNNTYSVNNVYYSRNTISYNDLAEEGKYLLTTIIGSSDGVNAIVESIAKWPNEQVTLTVSTDNFNKWVVSTGNVALPNVTSPTITFTMPDEDVTIIADFEEIMQIKYD